MPRAGERPVERQRADDEQEAEGAPLDHLRTVLLVALLVIEGKREAKPKLTLVGALRHHLLDDTDRDNDSRLSQGGSSSVLVAHLDLVAKSPNTVRMSAAFRPKFDIHRSTPRGATK